MIYKVISRSILLSLLLISPVILLADALEGANENMLLDPRELTPTEFIAAARNVRKAFYWEKKDLTTYVVLTKHLLATAIEISKGKGKYSEEFGDRVLGLGYDLASMTWPGWDEEGIEVTEELRKVGLSASKMIVEFADSRNSPEEVRHNNYWLYGAHLLTDGNTCAAKEAWQRSLELDPHNNGAGMNAWILLADAIETGKFTSLETKLKELDVSKKPLPDTANQIRTALSVIR